MAVRLAFALVGSVCCLLPASRASADDCDVLAARVVAGVRDVTFERKLTGPHIELKHPSASGLTVHCRVDDGFPEAISLAWKDRFPPSVFFDLVGQAGSIVTGARADQIRQTAIRCHQQVLANPKAAAEVTENGASYHCDVEPYTTIEVAKPAKKMP